jgi:uncharacterized repeat protein (TIGR03803 family)
MKTVVRERTPGRKALQRCVESLEQRQLLATLTTLATLDSTNGMAPRGLLYADGSGNLYGTAVGNSGFGVLGSVFKIPGGFSATPGPLTEVAGFNGANGFASLSGVVADKSGNLYGTVFNGIGDKGSVFKISGGNLSTIATFTGPNIAFPEDGALLLDAAGNLFGAAAGDTGAFGAVFKIPGGATANPGAPVAVTTFDKTNGSAPTGRVIADASGNLYGVAQYGGANDGGVVYKIVGGATANPGPRVTLATFNQANGYWPTTGLTLDAAGNLYGMTRWGGANRDYGTIFKIPGGATANPGTLTTLFDFSGPDGDEPRGELLIDAAGNIFGTTREGGAGDLGTVFKLDPKTGALTTLWSFDGSNGYWPMSGLIADAAGNLYGTTTGDQVYGGGTVFKLSDTGFVTDKPLASKAEVRGNGVVIRSGDTTPAIEDLTDFGRTNMGTRVIRTFVVRNTGTSPLTTSALTLPEGLTLVEGLSASIPVGGQDSFTVRLNAATTKKLAGNITFATNDPAAQLYSFAVRGAVQVPYALSKKGVLTVNGTSGNDSIRLSIAGNVLTLQVNNLVTSIPNASQIKRVVVLGREGNDRIEAAPSFNLPSNLNGNAGDDTIVGGAGVDVISGGLGNDTARRGVTDILFGVENVLG